MPDELFHKAAAATRRLRLSGSRLYAQAVARFLEQHDEDAITERLNDLYSNHEAKVGSGLHRAQMLLLKDRCRE
jgi:ribosomal 50S subunit-associated protein YjgA (DUF615 family)